MTDSVTELIKLFYQLKCHPAIRSNVLCSMPGEVNDDTVNGILENIDNCIQKIIEEENALKQTLHKEYRKVDAYEDLIFRRNG